MIKNKSFVLTCSVLRLCKDYSITTLLGKPEWSSTAPSIQHCMVVKYSYGSLQGNVPSITTATKAASAFIVVVALSFCPDATQLIQRCWHTYTVIRFALTSHALPYMDTLVIWPAIICACAYVCDRWSTTFSGSTTKLRHHSLFTRIIIEPCKKLALFPSSHQHPTRAPHILASC